MARAAIIAEKLRPGVLDHRHKRFIGLNLVEG
jgi:hypothetical protein